MDTGSVLSVSNLSCVRQQQIIFRDISFSLSAGESLLVEGENGSGKSTLLRLLTGLSTPTSGHIYWQQQYTEALHFIGHTNGIKLGLTVKENLQLLSHLNSTKLISLDETLEKLKLSAYQQTLTQQLSAGQKRRVALAKLFLFPKPIWILDEPLTALDVDTQLLFLKHLDQHLQQGGISVISSHHSIPSIKTLRLTSC